ncbi:hypothetical protein FRC09_016119 [Ceratobasidium sp. 395]|nr:hypothetical protein FRC09_016119 [Ceratobasidium sp. 395]
MHFLPLLALALLSSASPLAQDFTTRHVLRAVPAGWTAVASAPRDHTIDMRIGLKQARMGELLEALEEVSNPAHARYGMHLSKAQVDVLVAPRDETVKTVQDWLDTHGVQVTGRSPAGDWLHVRVPVKRAEQMLNTRYNVYRHTSGSHIVRSEAYALPRSLDDHVNLVQPTTFFGSIHERRSESELGKRASGLLVEQAMASAAPNCSSTITPKCLRSLYRTENYTPATNRSTIGITGYLGKFLVCLVNDCNNKISTEQYASHKDLEKFNVDYFPDAVNAKFDVEKINGGQNLESDPGTEANLDAQYTGAMSYPNPITFYSTGGRAPYLPDSNTGAPTNEPYLEWVDYMLAKETLPLTITTSYGDDEQTVPPDYARRVCESFAQLGARGVSLLFSSGKQVVPPDSGVGGGQCLNNSELPLKKQFIPTFPASCPFVTSVGATHKISPEEGVGFSQGGFSNYFERPDYQKNAVADYISSLGSKYNGLYNNTGRGFPDVSAQGENYVIIQAGLPMQVSGTSASCPTFAGVISLLNDYRLSQGKPPLGFLNPWLYANAGTLNDITQGNNPGCGTSGFNATTGWVSGLVCIA